MDGFPVKPSREKDGQDAVVFGPAHRGKDRHTGRKYIILPCGQAKNYEN